MIFSSFIWIFILPSIFISPILTISLNSWFSIWMSLEFNMMMFIPMIIFFNKFYKEISLKYFIIQSISSSLLIFSSNFQMINIFNENYLFMYMNLMINMSLLIKIGAAPFHFWFINMMNNMNWLNCLILMTWQKINPLILMTYNFNEYLIYISSISSAIFSSIFGLNHQSIRLILSYSSINHISWMLMILLINKLMLMLYFISYMIMNFSIIMILYKMNILFINQFYFMNNNKILNFFLSLNLFSISSMPPMFGFMIKWMPLNYIIPNNLMILMILLFNSLLSFYFYTRLMISLIMIYKLSNKFVMNFNNHKINMNMINFFMILIPINLWIMNIWMF